MLRSRHGGLVRLAHLSCLVATADALAKWNVALNLGREPGTSMPESWAASGARFFLQTQIEFGDDPAAEESFLGRGRTPRLVTAETAAFTGVGGRREVAPLFGEDSGAEGEIQTGLETASSPSTCTARTK